MGKLGSILGLLWQGREVADPAAWKRGAITVNTIIPLLAALVEILRWGGVAIAVSSDQLTAIAGGVLALFNVVVLAASDKRVGLPGRDSTDDPPAGNAGAAQKPGADAARDVGSSIRDPGLG
jgi:hypothetical protein